MTDAGGWHGIWSARGLAARLLWPLSLLYGAVLTETIFAWPGMGSYVVNSIQSLDFPAVMGFTVVVSMAYVLVNLAVDLAYMLLDPRIKEVG